VANGENRSNPGQEIDQEISDSKPEGRSTTNDTDPDHAVSSNVEGRSEEEQSEATLVLVPNRQNSQTTGSPVDPLGNGAGVGGGLDLTSTEGINPFVGEGKPAASTVFVIDVSGSMRDRAKLPRVMNALTRAIDQLSEKQQFCVLLFDHTFHLAPWVTGLTAGTADNKRRIKAWLAQPPGGGGTEPMGAMAAAIELRPERIVLLSDGEFDPTNILTITSMNHQLTTPARIDCVGLQEDVLVLREIANKNKGIYYQAW
jgi:Mg-chelatase subunit ChlD